MMRCSTVAYTQEVKSAPYCITEEELALYQSVNTIRNRQGASVVPLSASLCYVASVHAKDLSLNHPFSEDCSMHSWSANGRWSACCYRGLKSKDCMLSKPSELTSYKGKGYEMVFWHNGSNAMIQMEQLLKKQPLMQDIILCSGAWKQRKWNAMGVGIFDGYVSVWFGELLDKQDSTAVCDTDSMVSNCFMVRHASEGDVIHQPKLRYYLIVSSFREEQQAIEEVGRLRSDGYSDARVVQSKGRFRVAVSAQSDLRHAAQMRDTMAHRFAGIWILEK